MKNFFLGLSLIRQFALVSFPILLTGTLAIGWWVSEQVQDSVLRRMGGVTALYVDSFVSPHVQRLMKEPDLTPADRELLDSVLTNTPLGKKIISLKVWRADGRLLFSSDGRNTGETFAVGEGLQDAFAGNISSEISDRSEEEQRAHGQHGFPRVIETYTPIHADGEGKVIAAAEFYQAPLDIEREAAAAQRRSWVVVAVIMLMVYCLLFLVVLRGERTIVRQEKDLHLKINELIALNEQNRSLHDRAARASEQAILLNENFLQRISADVHDGPGQDLGFALMEMKNMSDVLAQGDDLKASSALTAIDQVRSAVQSALTDLRAISADLELPDIAPLGIGEIAARVVRDFQAKTQTKVALSLSVNDGAQAPFRVKVTLYRLLQECLANSFKHANGRGCEISVAAESGSVSFQVRDAGPGFELEAGLAKQRLGLRGMRQRVEVLRGSFEVYSVIGKGTRIHVSLPLASPGNDHD
jgi:signal transduction histidine kinase